MTATICEAKFEGLPCDCEQCQAEKFHRSLQELRTGARKAEPPAPNAVEASFATIQSEIKRLEAENDRLTEYLSTLYVNALRSTPQTRAQFVSFIVHSLVDFVTSGRHVGDAVKAFDAAQKCGECGAFSAMLGNGLCFECAPEGQWPCFASVDTHPKDGDVEQAPLVSGAVPNGETPND